LYFFLRGIAIRDTMLAFFQKCQLDVLPLTRSEIYLGYAGLTILPLVPGFVLTGLGLGIGVLLGKVEVWYLLASLGVGIVSAIVGTTLPYITGPWGHVVDER
jgi:hypothetical protein